MLNKLANQHTDLTPIIFKPEEKIQNINNKDEKKQHLNNNILNKSQINYDKHDKKMVDTLVAIQGG